MRRAARPVGLLLAVAVAVALVDAGPVAADAPEARCAAVDPFTAGFAAEIDRQFAGHHVTAAAFDERTGCEYLFRPGERNTTASVLKLEIAGGVFLRAQRAGRWLTPAEEAAVWPMITESANPPANQLWSSLGGVAGMEALDGDFGLGETSHTSPWGLTRTSARDQVRMVRQVAGTAPSPLGPAYREALTGVLRAVVPSQRWGVPTGAPPGWPVALKNGFAPAAGLGWRINSVGYVADPRGGGYAVAIMSDGWPDQGAGVGAVDFVARVVNQRLGTAPYLGFASPEAFVGRQYVDVFGRPADLLGSLWWTAFAGWDGAAAGPLVDALLASPEGGAGDLVARLYVAFLDRLPDLGGYRYWSGVLRAGAGPDAVAAAFASTPEFGAATSALDDASFVDWAYRRLLARDPDLGGAAYWRDIVARHGRGFTVLAMAATPETLARMLPPAQIVQVYAALLGRIPAPAEIEGWLGLGWPGRATFAGRMLVAAEYRSRVGV